VEIMREALSTQRHRSSVTGRKEGERKKDKETARTPDHTLIAFI
jgi:hypothetical protein